MTANERILSAYGVYPYHTEKVSDNLYKISDGRHLYALKRSKLTENTLSAWEEVYHQAYASQLTNVLPVYLTNQSELIVRTDDDYYYLTPWITDDHPGYERAVTNAYEAIGHVHAKTEQSVSFDAADVIEQFDRYQQYISESHITLLSYVALFEQNRFMSPFELQVCTHYHVLVRVLDELYSYIDQLKDALTHEQQWHYSLLHGNLDFSHIVHHNHAHVINWESATYDNAVLDLSTFLQRQAQYDDAQNIQLAELFTVYQDENPLTLSEHYLLTIYLLDPSDYIALVDNYSANNGQETMVKQVQWLERAFRRLRFGLQWSQLVEYEDSHATTEDDSDT